MKSATGAKTKSINSKSSKVRSCGKTLWHSITHRRPARLSSLASAPIAGASAAFHHWNTTRCGENRSISLSAKQVSVRVGVGVISLVTHFHDGVIVLAPVRKGNHFGQ